MPFQEIEEEMFDIERPEDMPTPPKVVKSRSNVGKEVQSNRPPVSCCEEEDRDEVDRPAMCSWVQKASVGKQQDEDSKNPSVQPKQDEIEDEEMPWTTGQHAEPLKKPVLSDVVTVEEITAMQHDDVVTVEEITAMQHDVIESPPANATDGIRWTNALHQVQSPPKSVEPVWGKEYLKYSIPTKDGFEMSHRTIYPQALPKGSKQKNCEEKLDSDYFYKMDTFPRGRITIINVKEFKRTSSLSDRSGTDKDRDGLIDTFLQCGFIVDVFQNPSKAEILKALQSAANEDYSNMSCCACAILSHGQEGIIYGNDDGIKISDITKMFQTRGLAGKPKFFIFQACLGYKYMDPIDAVDAVDGPGVHREEEKALTLPSEADFLYAYSTVPGYFSWRNSHKGSWFVESLVNVFNQQAHKMDVSRMLVRANGGVSERKSKTDSAYTDNKRQVASTVSQLRKELFLFPPYGPLKDRKIKFH
ncbi:caspase-3-like [Clytia hemisphaerica]|uniref:Uncharacterized protein n=2 Tax=Clytia hemisphaerica TaxID=252671 RepID=A0A7M5U711_9CNID|eukprot:TCONS_00036361-protein